MSLFYSAPPEIAYEQPHKDSFCAHYNLLKIN